MNKWINNDENKIIIQLYIAFSGTLNSFPLLSMWNYTYTNDFSKVSKTKKNPTKHRKCGVLETTPKRVVPTPFLVANDILIPKSGSLTFCPCSCLASNCSIIYCTPNLFFLVLSAMPKHRPKYKQAQYKATTQIIKAQIK